MRLRKTLLGVLSVCALASAMPLATASAQRTAHVSSAAGRASLLLRVPSPGVYALHITITSGARQPSVVKLDIGSRVRNVGTGGRSDRSELSLNVTMRSRALRIAAADGDVTLDLSARAQRLRSLDATDPQTPTTSGASGGAGSGVNATSAVTGGLASPALAPAPTSPVGTPGPPGDRATWNLVFDNEFDGSSLDTSLWSTGWYGSGITGPVNSEELECYDPAQVVESGGELDLNLIAKTETCDGQTRPYASGLISTAGKFNYTYGYLEVKAWLPGTSTISDWPGIWTDGQSWPTDGELDVLEGLGGQACWHFHDPQGAPGGCAPAASYLGGWHTFGADWEPGSVTYYYDGTAVGTVTSGVTGAPMYIVLDLAADNEYGGPLQAPATLRVAYVRLWQHPAT